jgi:hypothetical protein
VGVPVGGTGEFFCASWRGRILSWVKQPSWCASQPGGAVKGLELWSEEARGGRLRMDTTAAALRCVPPGDAFPPKNLWRNGRSTIRADNENGNEVVN